MISIISVTLLTVIVFQDFKYRQIFWITLPVLFVVFTVQSYFQNGLKYTALYFSVNACLVAFIFVSGILLVAVSKKQSLNETFKTFIGVGDVLFFLVLCTAFSPFMYLAYCGISALLAIIGYLAYNGFVKHKLTSSPFAGIMALSLIFLLVIKQFNDGLDFYDDELIAIILRFR